MMTARGHEVIHYGHEESDLDCTEHVTVLSTEDWNTLEPFYFEQKYYITHSGIHFSFINKNKLYFPIFLELKNALNSIRNGNFKTCKHFCN
jgi:hypothetical protein